MSNVRKHARFLAIDGEGINRNDGSGIQDYVMLCASTGEHIVDANGLSTESCLEFLITLKMKYPGYTFVGFGFNYDVNMILRDVTKPQLEQLWKYKESCIIVGDSLYTVSWIPSKKFTVKGQKSVGIYDVFGFFQSSFLKALDDWKIPGVDEIYERIEKGKASRTDFAASDIPEMLEYCHSECEMLVILMEELQDALRDAEIYVTTWNGAGSVAAAILRKYNVSDHHVPDTELPKPIQDAVMYAYFGGRFQMLQQGHFPSCYNYDIISAYPSEARNLPGLGGIWERSTYAPEAPYAIWLCEWDLPKDRLVMPFPYRLSDGEICYPSTGRGWYWQDEVRAARIMHPEIKVRRGFVFTPNETKKPFWFIDMVAAKRMAAKEAGKASQKAYKLGMNSLYGKLAQGMGWQGSVPRYRSYVWAGMITSNTRARLLEYSLGNESKVIAYATDGIFFDDNPNLVTGSSLGELELNEVSDFYMLASGIYFTGEESENSKLRTRGHHAKDLDLNSLREAWENYGPEFSYEYQSTRFYGLGVSLMLKDFTKWRKWVTAQRTLNFDQSGKQWLLGDNGQIVIPGVDVEEYGEAVRWHNVSGSEVLGKQYVPKNDSFQRKTIEDQYATIQLALQLDQPEVEESF